MRCVCGGGLNLGMFDAKPVDLFTHSFTCSVVECNISDIGISDNVKTNSDSPKKVLFGSRATIKDKLATQLLFSFLVLKNSF